MSGSYTLDELRNFRMSFKKVKMYNANVAERELSWFVPRLLFHTSQKAKARV